MKKLSFALSICGLFVFSSCGGNLIKEIAAAECKCDAHYDTDREKYKSCREEFEKEFVPKIKALDSKKQIEMRTQVQELKKTQCPSK